MRRILSIDGGGIKGAFAASFLAELEDNVDGSIPDYFDLIAGTSAGGIIALGLAMGVSARDLTHFFRSDGPRIFAGPKLSRFVRWIVRTKYDACEVTRALEDRLGDRQLWEARTRLLIPSQMLETGGIYIFKTPHHPDYRNDYRARAVDAALATSAAPTYFPAARAAWGPTLLDGGLWANNPVAVACAEAVGHRLRWPVDSIKVLSVGCTWSPIDSGLLRRVGITGWAGWLSPAFEMMMEGQSQGALGQAQNLLGPEQVWRVDRTVRRSQYRLDGVGSIESLIDLGAVEARHRGKEVEQVFLLEPVCEPFAPYYTE